MRLKPVRNLIPDNSLKWQQITDDSSLTLLDPRAPKRTLEWLNDCADSVGPEFYRRGSLAKLYRIKGTSLLLKESKPLARMSRRVWTQLTGIAALSLNLSLQIGLRRIGDRAFLPSGYKLTTPIYFAALFTEKSVKLIMTCEEGRQPSPYTKAVCTQQDRRAIYDTAFRSVGGNPNRLRGYDDSYGNLLIRTGEIVKLDACNLKRS